MIEGCTIRAFAPEDLPRLHEIREAAFKPVFRSFRRIVGEKIAAVAFARAEREQAEYLDKICAAGSGREVYVVERNGELIAFFSIALDHKSKLGELDLNAVDPDCQGEGVATWMYSRVLQRMKEAGMAAASVGTGADASHAPARRAYEKAGFGAGVPNIYLYKML